MPILKKIKNCSIIIIMTESLAKKIVVSFNGSVCSCFHVLFLYSICVIKLVESITPNGNKKIAIDSQEFFQSNFQKLASVYIGINLLCCTNLAIIIIIGVKNPPIITIQVARLRFFLSHS